MKWFFFLKKLSHHLLSRMISLISLVDLGKCIFKEGKYIIPTRTMLSYVEYLGIMYKLVATHIVGIEIVLHDYFSLLVLFICNFLFLGAISLLKFLRITLKFDISVTKELKLCSERTRMLRQSVWIRISETYIDRAVQFEISSKKKAYRNVTRVYKINW